MQEENRIAITNSEVFYFALYRSSTHQACTRLGTATPVSLTLLQCLTLASQGLTTVGESAQVGFKAITVPNSAALAVLQGVLPPVIQFALPGTALSVPVTPIVRKARAGVPPATRRGEAR